jgi:hypothetical protein
VGLSVAVMVFGVVAPCCTLLVTGELDDVACVDRGKVGPPACAVGFFCDGRCRACASRDLCGDGLDNDCNGRVDDHCGAEGGASGVNVGGGTAGAQSLGLAGDSP